MEHFQCAVVIPCLNEAGTIAPLIKQVQTIIPAVWVIDDGSSDATAIEAHCAGAAIIQHPRNLGKGAALRTGLQAVHRAGFRWAITMDGDGQHDPADIPRLAAAAASGADLVIGNRMHAAAHSMTVIRTLTNRWMSARIEKRAAIACPDSQCGFRMIRLDAWSNLTLRTQRFEIESEMLVAFARAGTSVRFVPISCQKQIRPSRIHPLFDTIRWLRWWFTRSPLSCQH